MRAKILPRRSKKVTLDDVKALLAHNGIDLAGLLSKPTQKSVELSQQANDLQREVVVEQKKALEEYWAAIRAVEAKKSAAAEKTTEAQALNRVLAKFRQ